MSENALIAFVFCLFFAFVGGVLYGSHKKDMKNLEIHQMVVKDSLEHLRDSE